MQQKKWHFSGPAVSQISEPSFNRKTQSSSSALPHRFSATKVRASAQVPPSASVESAPVKHVPHADVWRAPQTEDANTASEPASAPYAYTAARRLTHSCPPGCVTQGRCTAAVKEKGGVFFLFFFCSSLFRHDGFYFLRTTRRSPFFFVFVCLHSGTQKWLLATCPHSFLVFKPVEGNVQTRIQVRGLARRRNT